MRTILTLILTFALSQLTAQTVVMSGATSANFNESKSYTVEFRNEYNQAIQPPNGDYYWTAYGSGSVTSSSTSSATVQWYSSGSIIYEMDTYDNYYYTSTEVTVYIPVPNATNFNYTYNCGNTVVSGSGSAPSGLTWYWQTSSAGTSLSYPFTSPLTLTASSSIYLRALVNATYEWSDAQLITSVVVTSASPASGGTIGSSGSICAGSTPGTLTSVATCTDCTSYQWEISLNNSAWNSIAGASSATYTPGVLTTSTYYRRKATNICGSTYSNTVTISVSVASSGGTVSGNQSVYGSASGTLTLTGQTGNVIKWQKKEGNGNWVDVANTTTSLSFTDVIATTMYHAVVQNGPCSPANSTDATIAINAVPVSITGPAYIGPGATTSVSTNTGWYSYQWKLNGSNIAGATTNTYVANRPGDYAVNIKVTSTSPTVTSPATTVYSTVDQQSATMSYVASTTIAKEGITSDPDLFALNIGDYSQEIQYLDGLGRPLQAVVLGGSPNGKDVVQVMQYDKYGRLVKQFLPYARALRDGRYVSNGIAEQKGFYSAGGLIALDTASYALTVFEKSPLNRVIKQGSPGTPWYPNSTNAYSSIDHTIKHEYKLDTVNEVLLWAYTNSNGTYPFGRINASVGSTPTYFGSRQLTKTKTKDEDGHEIIEYADKLGHMILKRVQAVPNPSSINDTNYASTYYIYDDLGNLVCVIPPEASKRLPSEYFGQSDANKDAFLRKWAFRYRYDNRKRLILKQVPGADSVRMVYDKRDRIVMTQDGNQRSMNQWTLTKYDTLNRPVISALYTHGSNVTQSGMTGLVSSAKFCESYNGNSSTHGYTSVVPPISGYVVLTATYYDNYDFVSNLLSPAYNFVSNDISGQESAQSLLTTNKVTGTKVNVLGSSNYLWTVSYFDNKGRTTQTISDNYKGGKDRITSRMDFSGRVLNTFLSHSSSTHSTQTIARRFEYDHTGRLLQVFHKVNAMNEVILIRNQYNELGQLVDKKLHSSDNGTSFKQSEDFRYNIRGWLTSINNSQLTVNSANNDDSNDLFGLELGYDNSTGTGGSSLFNGNISSMKWSRNLALGSVPDVGYNFSYDAMNRIIGASYREHSSSWSNSSDKFSESGYSYDLNGNIQGLTRKSASGSSMDVLSYTYNDTQGTNWGNKLMKVSDSGDKTIGFIEPASTSGDDYQYDANGNMFADQNKGITLIKYNILNLPRAVKKTGADSIVYTYDATGRKLKQQVYGSTQKITEYDGEFIYENDVLQFVNHDEGRVVMTGTPEYQYHLKDHLGNARLTFTAKANTTDSYSTNFEASSNSSFFNYSKTNFDLVDHTDAAGSTYQGVQWLNGGSNGRVGLAKSFAVMPGDEISVSAYCKYMNLSTTSNPTSLITSLAAAFGVSSASTGEGLKLYNGLNSYSGLWTGGVHSDDDATAPKVFATILFFDKDYNLIDAAWDQVSTAGAQTSPTTKQPPHDLLSKTKKAPTAGYAYVFLSNEHSNYVDVYFDDVTFTYTPSQVVQMNDYYPFGLTFNSYSRENIAPQDYKYNGKELQDELSLNWLDYGARMYDGAIGRWMVMDPLAEKSYSLTAYRYGYNNPVRYLDPNGLYETDGHYWTVYLMGMLNGLGNVQTDRYGNSAARQLANATEWPDNIMYPNGDIAHENATWSDPIYSQISIHALTGGSAAAERVMSADYFMNASFEGLGLAAHRLGDSFAHTRMDGSGMMFDNPLGHLFSGHTPDKIAERPGLYLEYVRELSRLFSARFGTPMADLFTFEYIANSGGSTEQNSAILEAEVRFQEGASTFSVAGNQVSAINNYIGARNNHTMGSGETISRNVVYTFVDIYTPDGKGGWNKKTELRTFVGPGN